MKSAETRVDEVGLKRTYEAVEGNWPSFIYIPGEACLQFLNGWNDTCVNCMKTNFALHF